jgi:hypothetical protein
MLSAAYIFKRPTDQGEYEFETSETPGSGSVKIRLKHYSIRTEEAYRHLDK